MPHSKDKCSSGTDWYPELTMQNEKNDKIQQCKELMKPHRTNFCFLGDETLSSL